MGILIIVSKVSMQTCYIERVGIKVCRECYIREPSSTRKGREVPTRLPSNRVTSLEGTG